MKILAFNKRFPDEQSCRTHLKELRMREGVTCKKCECITKHYWLKAVEKFQCSVCRSRTNLKAGTIYQDSKLPLKTWFECIHLITATKKPFSALELQKQLDLKRYMPIWDMMRKIRLSMGQRDKGYKLQGEIELDDAFFEVVDIPIKDDLGVVMPTKKLTKGRGSERQAKVLIMCESTPREQVKTYKKNRSLGYVKMIVMDDFKRSGVNYEVKKSVSPTSKVISDMYSSFKDLKTIVKTHEPRKVKSTEAMKELPWVHTVISNCKRELLGTHHSIGRGYLQAYLNEFCYKLNRRSFLTDMFDRLLLCSVKTRN